MYVCKYSTLQDCQNEMARPLNVEASSCTILELNECQYVLEASLYAHITRENGNYVLNVYFEPSCTMSASTIPASDFGCSSAFEVFRVLI